MTEFVAIDVETANGFMGSICQIGAVRFVGGVEVEAIDWLIDPHDEFWDVNIAIHGITPECVIGQPSFRDRLPQLRAFIGNAVAVCHTHFDRVSLTRACEAESLDLLSCQWLDSARVARRTWEDVAEAGYGLANLAARCGISFQHHDACSDARTAGLILLQAIAHSGITLDDWPATINLRNKTDRVRLEGTLDGPLAGESICFTGQLSMDRKAAAQRGNGLGAAIEPGVTRKTTMLVVGDQDISKLAGHVKSSKHRKAEQLIAHGQPIRIVAERDFMAF